MIYFNAKNYAVRFFDAVRKLLHTKLILINISQSCFNPSYQQVVLCLQTWLALQGKLGIIRTALIHANKNKDDNIRKKSSDEHLLSRTSIKKSKQNCKLSSCKIA